MIPVDESTMEEAFYSYMVLKEYNCKPSLPKNMYMCTLRIEYLVARSSPRFLLSRTCCTPFSSLR